MRNGVVSKMAIRVLAAVLLACAGCGGGTSGGGDAGPDADADSDTDADGGAWPDRVFAPFVDATLYPVPELGGISDETGIAWYALGFIVDETGDSCTPSWGGYYDLAIGPSSWDSDGERFLYDEIADVRAAHGGDVVVSFGGAANTPLAAGCATVEALAGAYEEVIDALDLVRIDFDIEGAWIADAASIARRSQAIAQVQGALAASGRSLEVWFTLPVLPSGLTADGLAAVDDALSSGVALAGVNVMAMDYGDSAAPDPAGKMGEYAIEAITAVRDQLETLYTAHGVTLTDAALWAKIGVTPMIGMNDVTSEVFGLEDAAEIVAFADEKGLGMISMWSLNRDHPCPDQGTVSTDCSSAPDQDVDYEFSAAFGASP